MPILDRREPKIALPKEWPRVAKSAIVHALALAHFVVAHVRGWCADSPLRRVRLAAECERLRSEVALLREELRIKDARLGCIPPRNRPHDPPAERLAILALKAARGWNVSQAAARFLVESATIASWMGRTDEEGLLGAVAAVRLRPAVAVLLVDRRRGRPLLARRRRARRVQAATDRRRGLQRPRTSGKTNRPCAEVSCLGPWPAIPRRVPGVVRSPWRAATRWSAREDGEHCDHRTLREDVDG